MKLDLSNVYLKVLTSKWFEGERWDLAERLPDNVGAEDPWDYWEHVHYEQAQGQAGYPQGNVWEHVHHDQAQGQAGHPQSNVREHVHYEQAQGKAGYPQGNVWEHLHYE